MVYRMRPSATDRVYQTEEAGERRVEIRSLLVRRLFIYALGVRTKTSACLACHRVMHVDRPASAVTAQSINSQFALDIAIGNFER